MFRAAAYFIKYSGEAKTRRYKQNKEREYRDGELTFR